jgi:cell division protein FtsI (penicillin-binding protein 3)
VLVLAVFAARLVYVQLYQGKALAQQARDTRLTTQALPASRGNITDVDGTVLATSQTRFTVIVDQTQVPAYQARDPKDGTGVVAAANALSPLLGISAAELGADLNGTRQYKVLKKDVLPEQWRAIDDLAVPGITAQQTQQRVYPAGSTAGNLLGFVNADQQGAGGLELALNHQLSGKAGSETFEKGLGGQKIPDGEQKDAAAVPGDTVRLTLDQDIQWQAQDAVRDAVRKTGAQWGVAVVQDVKTGALYALADSSEINPNDTGTPVADRQSKAIGWTFEPGSTGKIITMAGLLQGGYAKPSSKFTVDYTYTTPNGQTFHDSEHHGAERLTLAGILAQSSNAGTVHAGSRMTPQTQYDNMRSFGLAQPTGLGLPGESNGLVRDPSDWDGRTRYTVLFGQGLTVNAVQAATVYSTVANGGVKPASHVVAGETAPDGTYTPAPAGKSTRVVSTKTASTLTRMLEGVVSDEGATGTEAAVPGYQVAGKTGTAQAANGKGQLDGYVASFVGFAPADHPRLTVGVFLKDPKTSIYGGTTAAPVFSKIMGFALDDLGVAPSTSKADPYPTTW